MENNKVKICIIKPNIFNINKLPKLNKKKEQINEEPYNKNDYKKKINYADIEKFKEITKNFIEIKEIETSKLMIEIEDNLNSKQEYVNVTEDIYSSKNYLFQMCFVDIYHENCDKKDINYIGSELTNENKALIGNCIIIKQNVPHNNNSTILENITYEDIYFLLMSELIHGGVIIGEDSKLTQIYFNNKLELVNTDKLNTINNLEKNYFKDCNYEGYKESILNFDFNIYVRRSTTYENNEVKINPIASKLYNLRVDGDTVFICKDIESNKYYDLFKEDIIDLLKVEQSKKKLAKEDLEEEIDENKLKIYKGRYRLLHKKISQ